MPAPKSKSSKSPGKDEKSTKSSSKTKKKPKMLLSVSRINLFEQCPQKYYYKYILKLPDSSTYHSAAGSFLHKALELFVFEYIKTSRLRESAQTAYIKAKNHPEITALAELITPELCVEVKDWLKSYVSHLEKDPDKIPKFLQAETRFRFQIEKTNIIVNGFIDRIDAIGDNTIHVIDYKTTSRPDYLTPFQLTVYTIPVIKMYPGKEVQASYELARQNFENKSFIITDQDRKEALDKFVAVGSQLETLISENDSKAWKPKPSALCNFCAYRITCTKDNHSSW